MGKGSNIGTALKAMIKSPKEGWGVQHDPGGLIYRSKNKDVQAAQADADWLSIGAKTGYEERIEKERVAGIEKKYDEEQKRRRLNSSLLDDDENRFRPIKQTLGG